MATYFCPTCSQDDFEHAVYTQATSPGDVIVLPAGSGTWGNSSRGNQGVVYLTTDVTVVGQGDATVINLDPTGQGGGSGVISPWSNTTFKNMKIVGSATTDVNAFNYSVYNGWAGPFRLSNITYDSNGSQGKFAIIGTGMVSGLIDTCRINSSNPQCEPIFAHGPSNAWSLPNTVGHEGNIFVEDCVYTGRPYMCDANSAARMVIRYNTINGLSKADGHGLASNFNPPRGFRNMEIYNNIWLSTGTGTDAIEFRGGTGMIFGNQSLNLGQDNLYLVLVEYGVTGQWPNFGSQYQTLFDYPITDQVGVGMDPKRAASEPVYLWSNTALGSDWGVRYGDPVPQGSIDRYRTQTGNVSATFTMADIIAPDRDYFKHTVGGVFDGSSGVGVGTKAQMLAITPTKVGVGFWVTDEGTWNRLTPNPSGMLYTWNGSIWAFKYMPYTYPHPLRWQFVKSALYAGKGISVPPS